jgi:hypothetical protein
LSVFFSEKKKKSKEMPNLARQKRLAMALFGVGHRKVWLDPTKMNASRAGQNLVR